MQHRRIAAVVVFAYFCCTASSQDAVKRQRTGEPALHMVAMRDGTRLATDVYLPETSASGTARWPAIVVRTIYGKSGIRAMAPGIVKRGYAIVVQDLRGKGKSEGKVGVVFSNDGWGDRADGHDTLAWVAKQEWCDGRIGMWGGSALGIVENLTAPAAPENLRAYWVLAAFSDMYSQCAYQGGVWRTELIEKWLIANNLQKESLPVFAAHPLRDPFWRQFDADSQASRVNAPGVFVGGWYDIFLQGTIDAFLNVQAHGGPNARGKCRLAIAPVAHGPFFELKYPNAGFPKAADAFRFYDHHLKGNSNGVPQDKPVHYYVMGDPTDKSAPGNYWREAESWPPPNSVRKMYFHADGKLNETSPTGEGSKGFQYDPKNPVPSVGGQNLTIAKGPMDQRSVEKRPDVLLFETETLSEPLEVTGRVFANLFVSSDCPDTDFTVKLTDVYPDGRSMLVTDGILRARFRNGFEKESFLEAGKVYELKVDLWSTSIIFHRGHKLRIALSSSNSPRFDPNPNTGKPFRSDDETRIAHNAIWMSRAHASHILLPIGPGK